MLRHAVHKVQIPARHSLREFGWLACVFCAAQGAFTSIFPLVLYRNLGNPALVGYYYALIGVIALAASIGSTVLFQRFSRVSVLRTAFGTAVAAIALMTLARNIWSIAGLDIPRAVAVLLANISFSLIVSDHLKKALAAGQGKMFAWGNVGWLIGPFIGGMVANRWGYEAAFIASAFLFLAALAYFSYLHLVVRHPHLTHEERHDEGVRELARNVGGYFRRPELGRIFRMSLGINFWWAIRGIYIPLSIISFGFGPATVGVIGALTGIPLIFMEGPVGKWAETRGVRRFMFAGFVLLVLFAIGFGMSSRWPWALFALFIASNIGAALVEPLQNTYFFKTVAPSERERFFGIYNTGALLAPIIAPVLGGLVIDAGGEASVGFVRVWLLLAAAMTLFALDAWRIGRQS